VPIKGFNRSKSENTNERKAHSNPENNIVVSEPERKLRKSIVAHRYTSPLKGKVAHKEPMSDHNHKKLEFDIPEIHNSKGAQTSSTPDSTSVSSLASTPVSPINLQIPIVQSMVVNMMDAIIVARYEPLVLPIDLHVFPTTDYMKNLPRYNGEGEVTVEEHLKDLYSFADNFNIDYANVLMRLFV
jgi:hypothetical protein